MKEAKTWLFEIEVEKREVNPRASDSLGGLINLHLTYSCSVSQRQENHTIFFRRSTLEDLDLPYIAENLFCAALRQSAMLRWCNNVQKIAKLMSMYLYCKYGFTPEFLSGQGHWRPCLRINLEVVFEDQPQGSVRNFLGFKVLDEHEKLIILRQDLRDLAKWCGGQVLMEVDAAEEDKCTMKRLWTSALPTDCGDCSICFESIGKFNVAIQTPCNHTFHEACIGKWLCANNSCPMCRSSCSVSI